jgi:putative membrane-bound dehydrogenase-like protein
MVGLGRLKVFCLSCRAKLEEVWCMSNSHRTNGKLRCSAVLPVAACCLLSCAGWSAESKPESNAAPRVPSAPVTNAPAGFRIKPGFRLELVAAEPVVTAPVAMAFDENGRLFVVERSDAPNRSRTNAYSGRIRLLEDTNGEGEFHTSRVYADNLPQPSALACYSGGVFVAAGPELIYLKDSRTNGIADVRNVIFTGFGSTNMAGAPAFPNNFNWGLDNRIHAASAGVAGFVPGSSAPGAALVSLTGADFSFDPRALTLCAEAGPSQSGLSFDNWGRKLTCDFTRPLRSPRYEPRYLARNPFFPPPPAMFDAASPATAVFRLVSVKASPPAAEGPGATNEPAPAAAPMTSVLTRAWLTNAQGCVVYRGGAFPPSYLGNVFVADPSAHLIHRFVLREAGLGVTAARAPDETGAEFVVSLDTSFRPVQIINGPDGALYVVDRQEAGNRGRIYRIVPADFTPPKPPRLGKSKPYDLAATLSHPNGWQCDTAARLLYERQDPKTVQPLANLLASSRAPLARLHALHALDGLGALNPAHVLNGLRDTDERVREHAVLLSEKLVQGGALPEAVWNQLRLMAADPSLRVRYQLAFTVGELRRPDSAQVLAAILLRDPANLWIQAAVFSSLDDGAGNLFVTLADDVGVRGDPVGQEWLLRLAAMIGVKARAAELAQVIGFMDQLQSEPGSVFALLSALDDGLHRTRSSLSQADAQTRLQFFYAQALNAVQNYSAPEPLRIGGMQLLSAGPHTFTNPGDVLLLLLGSGQSEAIQSAALAALGRFDDSRVAPALIQRWRVLTPRLRSDAITALLARSSRIVPILAALENGTISSADLSCAQVDLLRTHPDEAISRRARKLFGPVPAKRPEAVRRFRPALGLKGAPARGRDIFLARCAACHERGGATQTIGPDLAGVRIYGRGKVLNAVLEPNADVRRDYLTYVVETGEGEPMIGLLRDENPTTITLQGLKGGLVVLPRANIQYLQTQPWSLMPEGLEAELTPQNMADLLEYVITAPL